MTTKLSEDDVLSTIHLSSREAAAVLGVGKSTVNDARKKYKVQTPKPSNNIIADGNTLEEVLDAMRQGKTDLSNHTLNFTTVERELADGSIKHQYTVRATTNKNSKPQLPDADDLIQSLNEWRYEPRELTPRGAAPIFVVLPSDLQVGKVSDKGGTDELEARVKASFDRAASIAERHGGYPCIVLADLGDIIENFYNVASQRETNDRDLTTQVKIARKLMQYGINVLAPWCAKMYVVSVPSNHGSVRISFKDEAAHPSNDWGVAVNEQLEEVYAGRDDFAHIEFVRPHGLEDSIGLAISFEHPETDDEYAWTDTTTFGFVHGHQAGKAERLREWFAGQSLGRGPVGSADILLAGHFHSFRMTQGGDERWIIVAPSSDNGSDWFRRITGDRHTTGMLTFEASQGTWLNMEIV